MQKNYTTDAELLRPFAEERLETTFTPNARFLGRLKPDGTVWGVVVYDCFTQYDCHMHMAGDRGWINRPLLKAAFAYPFRQLGLSRVTGLVDECKPDVLRMDLKMGFQVEGVLRAGLGDRDLIVLGMKPSECRYS